MVEPLFSVPVGWDVTTLAEVAARGGGDVQTGPFGSQLHAADYVEQGIPSVMPQNIGDNTISDEGIARISVDDAERLTRYRLRTGDIVYSRRGDVEKRSLVRPHNNGWLCGTGCLRVRFGEGHVFPEYAAYYLAHPASKAWVVQHAVGATMPNLNTTILGALPFVLPPMSEQISIARILGSLDEKIELNRQMGKTLEAMAKEVFRDWFVDFGPTRRKLEGATDPIVIMGGVVQDPNRAKALTDLFPAFLGDDGIPDGWRLRKVEDIAARVAMGPFGSRITKDNFVESGIPVIRGKNLSSGLIEGDFVFLTPDKAKELSGSVARQEDIVFTHRGTLGQVGRIYPGSAFDEYVVSQSQLLLSVDRRQTSSLFLYHFFISDAGQRAWLANAGGAGVPAIASPTRSLKGIEFVDPGISIATEFDRLASCLEKRAVAAKHESSKLAVTRDLLIPKLMSGAIRLDPAEVD